MFRRTREDQGLVYTARIEHRKAWAELLRQA